MWYPVRVACMPIWAPHNGTTPFVHVQGALSTFLTSIGHRLGQKPAPRAPKVEGSFLKIGVNGSGGGCEWRAAPLGSECKTVDCVPWSWPHRVELLRGAQMGPHATSARIARGA